MNLEDPRWEEWEEAFMALAENAEKTSVTPAIKGSEHFLCLVGENGMTPEEEFRELELMREKKDRLKKVEIEQPFWQDTILFIP